MMSNVDEQQINSTIPSFTHYTKDYNISYNDKFVTEEQKQRDTEVTKLLRAYVKTYEKKVERNSSKQDTLFNTCIAIIRIFAGVFIAAIVFAFLRITSVSYTGLATIITASVSFISLVIGLLTIITKYFFPENEEQYITRIVEAIQQKRTNTLLFDEKFEVWRYGPVVRSVNTAFKQYGSNFIKDYYREYNGTILKASEDKNPTFKSVITYVWDKYKKIDGIPLANMSRSEKSAWYQAYNREDAFLSIKDIKNEEDYL